MENKEILKKAVDKAVENGWKRNFEWVHEIEPEKWYPWEITHTIFSHDFAGAFFGEDTIVSATLDPAPQVNGMLCWQYHLQMMVLEEEPIKYLEKFIN